jgi:hypothetical protein
MSRTEEDQKVANEMFDKLRDDLLSRDLSNTENYDKAILTLSSSSLALSITTIKFVVPVATATYIILLKSARVLLAISIVCSLLAYLISNKAMGVQLNNARDYYKKDIESAFSEKNVFTTINSYINIITGLTFAFAICLLITFITINIETGEITMTDKRENRVRTEKRSANIPNMESVNTTAGNSANVPTMEQAPSTATTSESNSSSDDSE